MLERAPINSRMFMTGWNLIGHTNILREDFSMDEVESLDAPYWVPAGSHVQGFGVTGGSVIWKTSIDRM